MVVTTLLRLGGLDRSFAITVSLPEAVFPVRIMKGLITGYIFFQSDKFFKGVVFVNYSSVRFRNS